MMRHTPYPGYHFSQRLGERFSHKCGKVDLDRYERITRITSNRYDHPKVMKYFEDPRRRDNVYYVSEEDNIIIPTTLGGKMKTVLWYSGHPTNITTE